MCRVEIPEDLVAEDSESLPPPSRQLDDPEFQMNPQLENLQRQMTNMYLRQKERGGIIDIEGEKNKFFIQISNHEDQEESSTQSTQAPASHTHSTNAGATHPPPQSHPKPVARRVDNDSSNSESEDGRSSASRARNRRGKNKMYPTPSEKKRAHLQALQLMKLEQNKTHPESEKVN